MNLLLFDKREMNEGMVICPSWENKRKKENIKAEKKIGQTFMPVSYFICVYMSVLRDDAFVGFFFSKTFYSLTGS